MKNNSIKSFLLTCLSLILGVIIGASAYFYMYSPKSEQIYAQTKGELTIHFLELGNKYAGDCIYIKANDLDILIDAGSRQSSSTTIISYINNYCNDNTLEYVIATHAHQDHIAAFNSTETRKGIFETYEAKNIIDFGSASTYSRTGNAEKKVYTDYVSQRNQEIANGANYYPVSDYNNDNFQKVFDLGEGITMTILNNRFYTDSTSNENDYSVCLLFTQGQNNILLTGDIEKDAEESLVELNTLPQCVLFKANHHGSYKSNTTTLLDVIRPQNVVFTCVAGSNEYSNIYNNQFPSQTAINNIFAYTTNCYVTSLCLNYSSNNFSSMNGNIVFTSNSKGCSINCSSNNTLLKDTNWFISNRTAP